MSSDNAIAAITRLKKEVSFFTKKGVDGVSFEHSIDGDIFHWKLYIRGPAEYYLSNGQKVPSPYLGARFEIDVRCSAAYPFKHPYVLAKPGTLYHPLVSFDTGEFCMEVLETKWGPTKTLLDLAKTIKDIIVNPKVDSGPNAEALAEFMEDHAVFFEKAKNAASKCLDQ